MNKTRYYQKKLEKVIPNEQYISTEPEFGWFINEDVQDRREDMYGVLRDEGIEEPYQGYYFPDIDDFSRD